MKMDELEESPREIRLDRLSLKHPPWQSTIWEGITTPITDFEVHQAVVNNDVLPPNARMFVSNVSRADHIRRIAYLVMHPTDDPVSIDVGCPFLGHFSQWWIEDGNHRVLAATYARRETIPAMVSGQLSIIDWLCGEGQLEDFYQWYV